MHPRPFAYKANALLAELCGHTNAGPAFRDLSRGVIGRFASIRFCPVVEKSNPTRPLSSPRPESNRQPSLYESAALPLCYEGELEQAAGLEPAISALATRCSTTEPRLQEGKFRVAFQARELEAARTSHRCNGDRAITGQGSRYPCTSSRWRDSNTRSLAPKASAIPLRYTSKKRCFPWEPVIPRHGLLRACGLESAGQDVVCIGKH